MIETLATHVSLYMEKGSERFLLNFFGYVKKNEKVPLSRIARRLKSTKGIDMLFDTAVKETEKGNSRAVYVKNDNISLGGQTESMELSI